jgi:hypothetical protein
MGKIPTITLDGTSYELDVPNQENNPESYRQKAIQEQFVDEERVLFWKSWTQRSWHEGERLERILSEQDLKAFRYHDAEGVDTALLAKWGEAKLTPSLARNLTVTAANLPMTVTSDGTTLILGLTATPFIKKWTVAAGWVDTTAIAGSGAVTDLITAGSTLYAVRGGAVLTSTDAGVNWTAVGSYTTATGVAWVNGELYVGKTDGVYNHTTSEAVTTEPTAVIAGYKENVYYGKDSRIYRYDGRAAYLYDQLPNGFNVTALVPYRMVLLILGYYKVRGGYRGAVYYIVSGSENHLYSLGDYSADHRIYACAGSDDEIFFANPKRGGADRYSLEVGGITGSPLWAAVGKIPFKSMAVCEGYLWVGRYDNVAGTDGVYQADIAAPTAYKTTGWLTTSEYDFDWANEIKLFRDIRIEHRALAAGQSVTVSHSLDGGTTYVQSGISNEIGTTAASFSLADVTANSIKLKFTLASGGSDTPTLTKCVVRAAPMTDVKFKWNIRILTLRKWGGDDNVKLLELAAKKKSQLNFVDVDGEKFRVVVDNYLASSKPDPQRDYNVIYMTIREV